MRRALTAAAAASTIVLPSFDDERRAFGDDAPRATARRYREAGAQEVAVKNGGGPVVTWRDGAPVEHPVAPVERLVDPTGAGDAFNGAYLASRLKGAGPAAAAGAGIATAARVIGVHGAIVQLSPKAFASGVQTKA